jgi:transformation/transcription domain-associated protein
MAAPPTPSAMEPNPHLITTSDLEIRAARIADPNIGMFLYFSWYKYISFIYSDLKTKHAVAAEIREMLDTIRDTESARALPYLIPALLELLRSGSVALHKDSVEYQFRRVLLEIINRLPVNEAIRPYATPIFNCMLHILRHDNEENGVIACKTLLDIVRSYRPLTDDSLSEFLSIFQEAFQNMSGLVEQTLSDGSAVLDPNVMLPGIRSFKVLGEMGMVMVIMSQFHRPMVSAPVQTTIAPAFEVLALEAPAQKKTREDYEAMGGIWAGMAPSIKNASAYSDFIHTQIKVCFFTSGCILLLKSH